MDDRLDRMAASIREIARAMDRLLVRTSCSKKLLNEDSTPNRVLQVSVQQPQWPITEAVLREIFIKTGNVEQIVIVSSSSFTIKALVQYKFSVHAIMAWDQFHNRYIYDGCCLMDVEFASIDQIPPCSFLIPAEKSPVGVEAASGNINGVGKGGMQGNNGSIPTKQTYGKDHLYPIAESGKNELPCVVGLVEGSNEANGDCSLLIEAIGGFRQARGDHLQEDADTKLEKAEVAYAGLNSGKGVVIPFDSHSDSIGCNRLPGVKNPVIQGLDDITKDQLDWQLLEGRFGQMGPSTTMMPPAFGLSLSLTQVLLEFNSLSLVISKVSVNKNLRGEMLELVENGSGKKNERVKTDVLVLVEGHVVWFRGPNPGGTYKIMGVGYWVPGLCDKKGSTAITMVRIYRAPEVEMNTGITGSAGYKGMFSKQWWCFVRKIKVLEPKRVVTKWIEIIIGLPFKEGGDMNHETDLLQHIQLLKIKVVAGKRKD